MMIHRACGGEITSELGYSDAAQDYYFPVCIKCQESVSLTEIEESPRNENASQESVSLTEIEESPRNENAN